MPMWEQMMQQLPVVIEIVNSNEKGFKNTVVVSPLTTRKKKGKNVDPLNVNTSDDVHAPYFGELKSKWATSFIIEEDLVLWKACAAVSKVSIIGMDQTVETF